MASRKQLKKSINFICSELFADCVALSLCQQANAETLDALMAEILAVHADYVSRISHAEPGAQKAFFKKLKAEFTEKANGLSQRIIEA